MALEPGTRLGLYEIDSLLGVGGMGEVYRARDARLGRAVAIKLLPASLATDRDRLRRFEQEARAAARLNHPNIVATFDVGSDAGAHFIVSELLEGETLRRQLRAGPVSPRKAVEYGLQIARGLAAAHAASIVHRDLKPENIFVTREGRLKILDFGLAKLKADGALVGVPEASTVVQADTAPGVLLGTVGYMSPEQVRGLDVDHRADIFALGAVMYELFSGQRAFQHDTPVETMNAILKEDPREIAQAGRSIPAAVDRIVRRCLEKNPEERFQSARDVAFALEALSDTSGSAAGGLPDIERSKRRLLSAVAIAALMVATATSAYVFARWSRTTPQPAFTQLTFRRDYVTHARFAPDGQTILYSARWGGAAPELLITRPGVPESRALGVAPATLAALSSTGMVAVLWANVLGQVPLSGGAPRKLFASVVAADWTPDGGALAIARRVDGQMRVELPPDNVLYQTPADINNLRVSPRGDQIAFVEYPRTNDDRGDLVIVDSDRRKVTLAAGFDSIQGVAWAPHTTEIWFAASRGTGPRVLRAITLEGVERVVLTAPGSLTLHDISRDGRLIVDQPTRRRVIMGRVRDRADEIELSWLDGSTVADLSADGRTLLFSEIQHGGGSAYSVYVRTTDGALPVRLGDGIGLGLSPDGQWALTTSVDHAGLFQLPTGVGSRRQVAIADLECLRALWLPSRRSVVVIARSRKEGGFFRAHLVDLESGQARPITPERVPATTDAALSPDGKWLAASTDTGRVWLYPIDGDSDPKPLPEAQRPYSPVMWSADGRAIYLRSRFAPIGLYVHDLDKGTTELVREIGLRDRTVNINEVRVSADGQTHVYDYLQLISELFLVEGVK